MRSLLLALPALPALLALSHASIAAQSFTVRADPPAPVQGTLFRVLVDPPAHDIVIATGSVAGEPLHFQRDAAGTLWALAAAPLDRDSVLDVRVVLLRNRGTVVTARRSVPVEEGAYPLERLRVAPRFGTPPDAATQARMDRERERALDVSRGAHLTPRLWDDVRLPRESRVTSVFGSGREFNGTVQSRHTGLDLRGATGEPVMAAARGIVALADTMMLAGRAVYLDHGAGLVTAYFHLSETLVAEGDTVQAGQRIGRVGATGRVTGPHLHWVVRYGPISVDPVSLMAIVGDGR